MLKLVLASFALVAYGIIAWPRHVLRSVLARRRLASARRLLVI